MELVFIFFVFILETLIQHFLFRCVGGSIGLLEGVCKGEYIPIIECDCHTKISHNFLELFYCTLKFARSQKKEISK